MKKTYSLFVSLFVAFSSFAQMTITYQNNALRAGDVRDMKEIEYKEYKQGGENQIWDFSTSKTIGEMKISQKENMSTAMGEMAFGSNDTYLACDEGPAKTSFFQITNSEKQYWGLQSGETKIEFNYPIIDMKFPFKYNDMVSGIMEGTYTEGASVNAINGNYFTSADAYGKLILPDGVIYDDVLRVRVEKIYEHGLGSTNYNIHTVRYQYFAKGMRYPVLIVLENEIKSDCNCACGNYSTTSAYYYPQTKEINVMEDNSIAAIGKLNGVKNLEVVPNPFDTEILISFNSGKDQNVDIRLIGMDGKTKKVYATKEARKGQNTLKLDADDVAAGIYTLTIDFADETKTLMVVKK